jgi:hypothetical protein
MQPTTTSVKGHRVEIKVRDLRVRSLGLFSPPVGDAAAGVAVRFVVDYRFTVRGRQVDVPVPFFLEQAMFGVARREVSLSSFSMSAPPSVKLEDRLYSTLGTRAAPAEPLAPAAVKD